MIKWALKRKMVPKRMVEAIMALYVETTTRVKMVAGVSEVFNIGVGVLLDALLMVHYAFP